jgi:hypothetical protein
MHLQFEKQNKRNNLQQLRESYFLTQILTINGTSPDFWRIRAYTIFIMKSKFLSVEHATGGVTRRRSLPTRYEPII